MPTMPRRLRHALALLPLVLAACAAQPVQVPNPPNSPSLQLAPQVRATYSARDDGQFVVPAIPARHLQSENIRRIVNFWTDEPAGAIVVDPYDHYLYYVLGDNTAIRYRVGVGEAGRNFAGRAVVQRKAEWPRWTPTANMLREDPDLYGPHRNGMEGGLENPLGARAMYLYRNGRDTLYRIHGTYAPWSIGQSVSAGCIRMFNQDVIDLYERVGTGTRVRVLAETERGYGTTPRAMSVAGGDMILPSL
jgi:lipoprotein-anchoring transpeptidase ErfK/SrfK